MQAHLPAMHDPFDINHEARVHSNDMEDGWISSGDAHHGKSHSSYSQEHPVVENDTFSNTSVEQTVTEVYTEPRKSPPIRPGPGANKADLLEYIKQQLDCYGKEPLLMNRYQLLGPDHRKAGGAHRCLIFFPDFSTPYQRVQSKSFLKAALIRVLELKQVHACTK
jgi:hypothetical protein